MDHPDYLSPLQKFLRSAYLHMLSSAAVTAKQAKWLVTGTAAILAVVVANLASIHDVVESWPLKFGIISLTLSMLAGVLVVLLAIAIKYGVVATKAFSEEMAKPETQASLKEMNCGVDKVIEGITAPFYGPLAWYLKWMAWRGTRDYLASEKSFVFMMGTIVNLSVIQGFLGAAGLIVLVFGIKD